MLPKLVTEAVGEEEFAVSLNQKIRREVIRRDGGECRKCGRRISLELHHIQPRRSGGQDTADNLITLCWGCHWEWEVLSETTKYTLDEWLPLPTAATLVELFEQEELWTEQRSAKELRDLVVASMKALRSLRGGYGEVEDAA